MLMIEVGQPIPPASSITGASLMTVAQMLRNNTSGLSSNSNNNSISNNNSSHNDNSSNNDNDNSGNNNSSNSNNNDDNNNNNNNNDNNNNNNSNDNTGTTNQSPLLTSPSTDTTTNANTSANARRGIRGLDYPAFDVSSEGVYNDDSQAVSRFLAPLQRVFERVYGQNENNAAPSITPEAGNTLPDVGLSAQSASSSAADPSTLASTVDSTNPPNSNTLNNQQTPPAESRNIILTVNYVYGGSSDANENNSGSLLLYVPSIDETNEDNVSVLVRLATEIALRTIAVSLRNSAGVSKQTFEALEVRKVKDLKDNEQECPICYEKYVDKETDDTDSFTSKKRKQGTLDDDDETQDEEAKSNKRGKDNNGNSTPISNVQDEAKDSLKVPEKAKQPLYTHYPVVMKCGHVFGASCLSEWFKTNSSCPLCRKKIPNVMETAGEESRDVAITLPNLARIISNCRPLIENFNNRLMTFSLSDEDGYNNTNIVTDNQDQIPAPSPFLANSGANILERLSTMRRNQQLERRPRTSGFGSGINSNTDNSSPGNNRVPSTTNRQSLVNFIRDIVSSLSRRSGDEPASRGAARLGLQSASGRIPIVRPVSRSGTQFSGMFAPLGVESRRTANGVETREISMFGDHRTTTTAPAPSPPPVPASSEGVSSDNVVRPSQPQSALATSEAVNGITTTHGVGTTENSTESNNNDTNS